MGRYTLETLKEINASYDFEYEVTEKEVEMANRGVALIESTRRDDKPQVGDIVEVTDEYGIYYENAHIESAQKHVLDVCLDPYVPFVEVFVDIENTSVHTSTSGGPWRHIPANLKLIGKRPKMFKWWGRHGPCGNGSVRFQALVNVWEFVEGNPQFTTKTHDRFDVWISENPCPYKYRVHKRGYSYIAFAKDEEYVDWLREIDGVEFQGNWPNQRIVWAKKTK